jgi:hypothetical protein
LQFICGVRAANSSEGLFAVDTAKSAGGGAVGGGGFFEIVQQSWTPQLLSHISYLHSRKRAADGRAVCGPSTSLCGGRGRKYTIFQQKNFPVFGQPYEFAKTGKIPIKNPLLGGFLTCFFAALLLKYKYHFVKSVTKYPKVETTKRKERLKAENLSLSAKSL